MLHAARKLKPKQLDELDTALGEVEYTCGTELADFVPDDSESEAEHILKPVFVRKDLSSANRSGILQLYFDWVLNVLHF